jgi:hypothetical protein
VPMYDHAVMAVVFWGLTSWAACDFAKVCAPTPARSALPACLSAACLQVGVRLTPSGPSGSGMPGKRATASISSNEVMELTVAPSCIIASKQLQALVVASKAWQGEQALLQHLAAPAAGCSLSAAGASCWLVTETGAPLS